MACGWRKVVGRSSQSGLVLTLAGKSFLLPYFSFLVSKKKKQKTLGGAGGCMISEFLFQALKVYDVKVVICKSTSVLFGIFKKTHLKSKIYKTDQCSGDFSSAKEFLEPLHCLSGLV